MKNDSVLTRLWDAVDDAEECMALRRLLVKAGLMWWCVCGAAFDVAEVRCEYCGGERSLSFADRERQP